MVLSAASFLLNRGMKFLLCGCVADNSGCAPQAMSGTVLCVHHIRQQKEMLCVEPVLCTGVCVSALALVAAEMAEYLSREWECL